LKGFLKDVIGSLKDSKGILIENTSSFNDLIDSLRVDMFSKDLIRFLKKLMDFIKDSIGLLNDFLGLLSNSSKT